MMVMVIMIVMIMMMRMMMIAVMLLLLLIMGMMVTMLMHDSDSDHGDKMVVIMVVTYVGEKMTIPSFLSFTSTAANNKKHNNKTDLDYL